MYYIKIYYWCPVNFVRFSARRIVHAGSLRIGMTGSWSLLCYGGVVLRQGCKTTPPIIFISN